MQLVSGSGFLQWLEAICLSHSSPFVLPQSLHLKINPQMTKVVICHVGLWFGIPWFFPTKDKIATADIDC